MKKYISYLALAAIMCGCLSSCKDKTSESSAGSEEIDPIAATAIAAEAGDAFLAIVDGDWKYQYWGKNDDPEISMLCYDAAVPHIDGNGNYTVSVTSESDGFKKAYGDSVPKGLEFLAVMIQDGEKLYPDAAITITEIKVNGKAIPMSAKAYTSSDDGITTRANIMNQWLDKPTSDARSVYGKLYDENGTAKDICAEYSPVIVSTDDFAEWTSVEVNFTVSGI